MMIDTEMLYREVRDTIQDENCLTQIFFDEIRQLDVKAGKMLREVECPNNGGLFAIMVRTEKCMEKAFETLKET